MEDWIEDQGGRRGSRGPQSREGSIEVERKERIC